MKAWMVTCFLPSITGFGNFTVYTDFEEVRSKLHVRQLEALCKREMNTTELCALSWHRLPDDDREDNPEEPGAPEDQFASRRQKMIDRKNKK